MTSLTPHSSHHKIEDSDYKMVAEGRIRIWIGLAVFSFALLLIVLRLAEVALMTQPPQLGGGNDGIFESRADIHDRNGKLLATTINNYALYAKPRNILDKEGAVSGLFEIFPDLNVDDTRRRISGSRDEVRLARGLIPAQRRALLGSGLPGLFTKSEPMRSYPNGAVASHILGFVDVDMSPQNGVEYSFNDDITANDAPPKTLSLDLSVQLALEDEIAKTVDHFSALAGAGVVLNIKTGEVLGMPLTVAMALDRGVTTLDEEFPVHKGFTVQKKFIKDDHPSKTPYDAAHILSESSNRGTALMALRAGGDMQQAFFKDVGLFDKAPIELPGRTRPRYHSDWQDISIVTTSYGHGISVTPLHLASAIGSVLNGGTYIAPTLSKIDPAHQPLTRRVISEQTSKDMAQLMRFVVTDGTGRNADVPGLGVMGKTGTADKPAVGGYDTRRLVTSFVGAFPVWDPNYLVLITLDEPKAVEGTHGYATAGWNAAPTAGRVMARIAPMVDVPEKPADETAPITAQLASNQGALQ